MGDLGGPYDAVVIGSGMSGLVAANLLAMHDRRVLVLEQHHHFGGYLQNFMLHRTPFDSGCHYVGGMGEGQVFDRYLRYLGVRDALSVERLDEDGFDVLDYPDWSFAIPMGYARLEARLVERFPDEAAGVRRFLAEVRQEVLQFPMYTLAAAEDPMGRSLDPDRTVADVLDACGLRDLRVREILSAYRALYFVPTHEASFAMHAFVFDSFVQGAYAFHGGGNAVMKALVARLRAQGGVARRRVRVTAVDVDDHRRVRGVHTADGAYVEAPLVIAAIDPKVAVSLLPDHAVRPAYRHRVERLRPGIGGLGAYLRVDADLSRLRGTNHFLQPSREGEDPLFSQAWLEAGTPPPVFVTATSTREPGWRGPHTVVVLSGMRADAFARWADTRTGARGADYEALKAELGARMLAPVRALIPELDTHLVTADFSTPLTHRDYTLNGGGAIYGIHHDMRQSAGRGVSWRTRVQGFLLSGHSVLYPGLIGAMISAFYSCGEVLGLRRLFEEVRAA
ncbi:MAG: NAD(P)/FAD-dependent oxidoreductase [Deltaproteobacteria bacterium]|nr:NAD(P)/FAD-dependent oxidoreductase [Deltaproteobacteria bacterium]